MTENSNNWYIFQVFATIEIFKYNKNLKLIVNKSLFYAWIFDFLKI